MTEKENAPAITDAQSDNDGADSTAPETERAIYNPMTWRTQKPARFRGKGKRRTRADAIGRTRADAIGRKRGEYGRIAPELIAWLAILAAFALAGWLAEVAR